MACLMLTLVCFAMPSQKSIKDFFRAPPAPPSAEPEAKRRRTIDSYFAAAATAAEAESPAGGTGGEGPGCAVPTPAQRTEAGSSTAKRPSCSQWGLPGRTANPKPSCARRISLGTGVHALAAHRREVSIREASNEAPSSMTDAGAASAVSAEHSELAPAGPAEHQQGSAEQQSQPVEQGPSLLRRMLNGIFNQQLPVQAVLQATGHATAEPARVASLLCHSQLEQTAATAQGRSSPAAGQEGISRVLDRNRLPVLSEYDQATVQSPPDDAAAQHMQPVGLSAGPSEMPYVGPEESMGDNGSSRHTYGAASTAADASRAPADSQKENAQAQRGQLGVRAGGQQPSPGKSPRRFGTVLGVRAADYGLPSSTVRGESNIVASDLS